MNAPATAPVWLVVPIDVAALCVGTRDTTHQGGTPPSIGPLADFSKLPPQGNGPYLSKSALPPDPFAGQQGLECGIHIHWALPDALTSGQPDATGAVEFPSVPNRWLVTRIVVMPEASAPPPVPTSWVIDSDLLSRTPAGPRAAQPTVPMAPEPSPNFRYIGQATPLAGWSERAGAERLAPFTAIGYGEPTFAALYPNCSSVFGFLDTLADVPHESLPSARIAYHVAGWYADPASCDPLARASIDPQENPYRWWFGEGSQPTRTLCSGIVHAIPWDPSRAYLADDLAAPAVAVGGSTAEALSALLASELPAFEKAEALLNALQFGLLGRNHEIGSSERFEEAVHAAGFASRPGGTLWTITAGDGRPGGEGEELTLPDELAGHLDALNELQVQYDEAQLHLAGLRRQLFLDWWKYMDLAEAPSTLQIQRAAAASYLQRQVTAIGAAAGALSGLYGRVQGAVSAIGTLDSSMVLEQQPLAPRYYSPSEPVLVLSGVAARAATRYGGDGLGNPRGYLACRRESELVTSVEVHAGAVRPTSAEVTVRATDLPALAAQPADAPIEILTAALHDAIFLASSTQPLVARAAAGEGGAGNPATLDFAAAVDALTAATSAFLAQTPNAAVSFTGHPPDRLLLREWAGTPWLPIMLQWKAQLQPIAVVGPTAHGASYPSDLIQSTFGLPANDVDLQLLAGVPSGAAQVYSGSAILSPAATVDLTTEIGQFIAATGVDDPQLDEVLAKLAAAPLLSQGLSGLNEGLLMHAPLLQLPVADPSASQTDREALIAPVATAVGVEKTLAPLPETQFNPLRAGMLKILELRLIDAFGRTKDYENPTPIVAGGLTPPAGSPSGQAFLPPRITQPARLLFRWRAAFDDSVEMNSHPATSPVIGWAVPDYLDNSIVIYDAAGTALGELGLGADREAVLFTPAPGGRRGPSATAAEVFNARDVDAHLSNFALGVYNNGDAAFLRPFFEVLRPALELSLPASFKQDAGTALLLGQPLVLARASLELDLAGPSARDESWGAFATAVAGGAAPADAGLGELEFPVALGSPAQLDDTMIGYWIVQPTEQPADYRTFYTPFATAQSGGGVQLPTQRTLTLTPGGRAKTVTILLDPRGCVHAKTGILPVKSIAIPPDQYAEGLQRLAVTFATRPVLSGSATTGPPVLVQPKVVEGQWSWVAATPTGWNTSAIGDAPPVEATLDHSPQRLLEGWLRLTLGPSDEHGS